MIFSISIKRSSKEGNWYWVSKLDLPGVVIDSGSHGFVAVAVT